MTTTPLLQVEGLKTGEVYATVDVPGEPDIFQAIDMAATAASAVSQTLANAGRFDEAMSLVVNADFLLEPQRRRERALGATTLHG